MYETKISNQLLQASVFLLLVALCNVGFAQVPGVTNSGTELNGDQRFVQQASQDGLAVVELSRLAMTSASLASIRQFAQRVMRQHTENNLNLISVAARQHIATARDLDQEHLMLCNQLESLHGLDFDRAYIDAVREDHLHMTRLLASSDNDVASGELRSYAKSALPIVQANLKMALAIQVQ